MNGDGLPPPPVFSTAAPHGAQTPPGVRRPAPGFSAPNTASDPRVVAAQEKLLAYRVERARQALARVAASAEGREALDLLLEHCHLYATSYDADVAVMAAREGERNVGLWLLAQLNQLDLSIYPQLLQERAARVGHERVVLQRLLEQQATPSAPN